MKIYAAAKLNLCLDILKKDTNGYHEIRTVLYEYKGLRNEIEIEESQHSQNIATPQGPAGKAYTLLKNRHNPTKNLSIKITRNIPPGSGLGGESSNAAAILKALNQIWNLKLSTEQLQQYAAEIGMDTPFFIEGGTAIGTHFGEKITPLPHIKLSLKIHHRGSSDPQKTQHAYQSLNLNLCGKNTTKTEKLIRAIRDNDLESIEDNLHNDFETIMPSPMGQHLSGAGPSTFEHLFSFRA